MATKKKPDPAYCLHKPSGRAYVTLPDPTTGKRRVEYLGEYGTAESHAEYARVVTAWKQNGRVVDGTPAKQDRVPAATRNTQSTSAVILAYWRSVQKRYGITDDDKRIPSNASKIKQAVKRCRRYAGTVPANEFDADTLEVVRDGMIEENLNREYINDLTTKIKKGFKWAAQKKLVPASTWHDLSILDRLDYGEQGVKEPGEATAVPWEDVDATLPHLTPQVAAIADLMRHTGMRPGEAVQMTLAMIDTSKTTWWYYPEHHKTKHRGKVRRIPLGPKARQIVKQFMPSRALDKPLFSPAEAAEWTRERREAERITPKNQGNVRGSNRVESPAIEPGEQYEVASVTRAIKRACKRAGVPDWTAKQCRNAAAEVLLREFGPEQVVLILGHSSYDLVKRYAGFDYSKAEAAIERIG